MSTHRTPAAPLPLRLAGAALACLALLFTGAASCDGGPGVPAQGERGDGYGNGGPNSQEDDAGDEVGEPG